MELQWGGWLWVILYLLNPCPMDLRRLGSRLLDHFLLVSYLTSSGSGSRVDRNIRLNLSEAYSGLF